MTDKPAAPAPELFCDCLPSQCLGRKIEGCRWRQMERAGWTPPAVVHQPAAPAPESLRDTLIGAIASAVVTERQGRYPGATRLADAILTGERLFTDAPAPTQGEKVDDARDAARLDWLRNRAECAERVAAEWTDKALNYHADKERAEAERDEAVAMLREALETGGLVNDLVRDRIDGLLAKHAS